MTWLWRVGIIFRIQNSQKPLSFGQFNNYLTHWVLCGRFHDKSYYSFIFLKKGVFIRLKICGMEAVKEQDMKALYLIVTRQLIWISWIYYKDESQMAQFRFTWSYSCHEITFQLWMVILFDITGHNVIKIEIRVIVPSVHNKILSDESEACHLRVAGHASAPWYSPPVWVTQYPLLYHSLII